MIQNGWQNDYFQDYLLLQRKRTEIRHMIRTCHILFLAQSNQVIIFHHNDYCLLSSLLASSRQGETATHVLLVVCFLSLCRCLGPESPISVTPDSMPVIILFHIRYFNGSLFYCVGITFPISNLSSLHVFCCPLNAINLLSYLLYFSLTS